MPDLAGTVQQHARPAADVQYRLCRHHQWKVEAEVIPLLPWMEYVVQLGKAGIGELVIDHEASLR
jgi:hypothetical protein